MYIQEAVDDPLHAKGYAVHIVCILYVTSFTGAELLYFFFEKSVGETL